MHQQESHARPRMLEVRAAPSHSARSGSYVHRPNAASEYPARKRPISPVWRIGVGLRVSPGAAATRARFLWCLWPRLLQTSDEREVEHALDRRRDLGCAFEVHGHTVSIANQAEWGRGRDRPNNPGPRVRSRVRDRRLDSASRTGAATEWLLSRALRIGDPFRCVSRPHPLHTSSTTVTPRR